MKRAVTTRRKFRESIRHGEALAIRADLSALEIVTGIKPNYSPIEGVCCVTIRGPLEHHAIDALADDEAYDSYENIRERLQCAFDEADHCVIVNIDSPGGVVSGLNETVYAIRRMQKAAGKDLIFFVNEMCCSAALALSTAATEVVLPPSAIIGSCGVISTMTDQVAADKAMGLNYVTITSGDRKADGHVHVSITDEMIEVERGRVKQLADTFFGMVAEVRPVSAEQIRGYQAAIFMGQEGVDVGFADSVMSWEDLLAQISVAYGGTTVQPAMAQRGTPAGAPMLKLKAAIASAKKRLARIKSPAKRKALRAAIAKHQELLDMQLPTVATEAAWKALKKTKYKMTEEQTTEDDGGDDDTSDDSEEEEAAAEEDEEEAAAEEDEEAAAAEDDEERADGGGGNDTDRKEKKKAVGDDGGPKGEAEDEEESAEAEDDEEEAMSAESEDEEEEARGKKAAKKARAALAAQKDRQLAALIKKDRAATRAKLIDDALKARRITPRMAKDLRTQKLGEVKGFLKMMKRPIVMDLDDGDRPEIEDGRPSALSPAVLANVAQVLELDPTKVKPYVLPNKPIGADASNVIPLETFTPYARR